MIRFRIYQLTSFVSRRYRYRTCLPCRLSIDWNDGACPTHDTDAFLAQETGLGEPHHYDCANAVACVCPS